MTHSETRARVDELNRLIQEKMNPVIFVVDPLIMQYSNEIDEIQANCQHEFKNGMCKYCDKVQPKN